jgi:hypothetical protein
MIKNDLLPNYLSHYYERAIGPFRSLSRLPLAEAEAMLQQIRARGDRFASRRSGDYLSIRRELEDQVRRLFIQKGGQPQLPRPHYLVLGSCEWLQSWYLDGQALHVPLSACAPGSLSFTYGDTFPAMRYQDGQPYRGQVYTLAELSALIEQYGLPQIRNPHGELGPDRYIEAQLWADAPVIQYLKAHHRG